MILHGNEVLIGIEIDSRSFIGHTVFFHAIASSAQSTEHGSHTIQLELALAALWLIESFSHH